MRNRALRQRNDPMLDDTTIKVSSGADPSAGATAVTNSNERPKPKDIWDKIDVIGKLLGSILIPIAVTAAGFFVNLALQDRAAKQKTAEIAITVLQSKDTSTPELRKWALGVFENTLLDANQQLPAAARKEAASYRYVG
jgi:hypothetical protein